MNSDQYGYPTTHARRRTTKPRPIKAREPRKCRVCGIDMEAERWPGAVCPDCANDLRNEYTDHGFIA